MANEGARVTSTIVALSLAYAVLGLLLLAMLLRARIAWWIKAAAIVVVSGFYVVAFENTRALLGWPRVGGLPDRFQLVWTRIVEPSVAYNEPGAIYLWIEELDANNVPSGVPRSFKIRYTRTTARKAESAREQIVAGKPQEGTAGDIDDEAGDSLAPGDARPTEASAPDPQEAREASAPVDPEFLLNAQKHLEFAPLPAPLLPAKAAN